MTRTVRLMVFLAWFCTISGCSVEDDKRWLVADGRTLPASESSLSYDTAPGGVARSTVSECGPYTISKIFPIKLEIAMPEEVRVGKTFTHSIKVTNLADTALEKIVLDEPIARDFTFVASEPTAKMNGGNLTWIINSLKPHESREISVVGTATSARCIAQCATVTCTIPGCAWTNVVQPELALQKNATQDALVCEPIEVQYVLTNSGTGTASGLQIVDILPTDLTAVDGKGRVTFYVDRLAGGESKAFSAELTARKVGRYSSKAIAKSADGFTAESLTTETVVRQPSLKITMVGPERLYFGRRVDYEVKVRNDGDATAENTVIEGTIPLEATSATATNGGLFSGNKVRWLLGTIGTSSSKTVNLSYMPSKAETTVTTGTATADCADSATATASTSVLGIAAILLEVVDLEDPIEVGGEVTYVITATNQGSRVGTNIRIVCALEANQQFISASGATMGTEIGREIRFTPLPRLAPKDKATWRVVARAIRPGDVRFKVTMNTGEFERPVEETEATYLYE